MAIWNTRSGCYLESHYIYCRSRTLYSLFRCIGLLSTSTLCFSTDLATYFFFWVPPCYSVIPDLLCTCIYQAVAYTQSHNFSLHCFFSSCACLPAFRTVSRRVLMINRSAKQ